MSAPSHAPRWLVVLLGLIAAVVSPGCAHLPAAADPAEVDSLRLALGVLAPTVRSSEAESVAAGAFATARSLAERYRVVRPASLHNLLVNSGVKERGLCFEWAEDLLAQLELLQLETLELHWGIARAETAREHNALVITARGQPFADGIVLDLWRKSGRLFWAPVATDRYPWEEGELTPSAPAVTP